MTSNSVSRRIFRVFLQYPAPVWLLVLLLASSGSGFPMVPYLIEYPYQVQNPAVYYAPLIAHRWSPPPPLLVSEVLYDPVDDEPAAEWIELYNYGMQGVGLSAYKVGDAHESGSHEGMYIFPPGAVVSPGEAIIIALDSVGFERTYGFKPDYELNDADPAVPEMIKDATWGEGSLSLSNLGDEILLLTLSSLPVDVVSWGSSNRGLDPPVPAVPEGHSIERYPPNIDSDTYFDWRDQPIPSPGKVDLTPLPTNTPQPATPTASPTLTQAPSPTITNTPTPIRTAPPSTHLLVSEVLFFPHSQESQNEWIEIYNPTPVSIILAEFKIGDEESNGGNEGMLQFPPGSVISPGQWVVIAFRANYFQGAYGFNPDFEMEDSDPGVPDMLVYSAWASGSVIFDDWGDEVLLLGAEDILIDALSWGTSNWAFNPPCLPVEAGHSLERFPGDVDTDSAMDWREQFSPNPGNPPGFLK